MSYCVNCGVELDDSQHSCPLCHVPVQNPTKPWKEPPAGPYPRLVENMMRSIDQRYGAVLATIALSIPVVCSILIDMLVTHRLTWSGYVTGGAACIFVWFLLPVILKKINVYLQILYNAAVLLLYLAAIFFMNEAIKVFLLLAGPLALTAVAYAYAVTPIFRSVRLKGRLYKPAMILFITAAFLVLIELAIDMYLTASFTPAWSLIAAAPCIVTGLILILLEKKKKLKDRIIRRLFL